MVKILYQKFAGRSDDLFIQSYNSKNAFNTNISMDK